MMTKIKTTVYAVRLRKKLAELKKKRPAELEAYHAAVAKWRKDLAAWVLTNAKARVGMLTPQKKINRWHDGRPSFDTSGFFRGAPNPPDWPDDQQIRDIQNLLRHLGITGQETLTISTEDVTKHLGGPEDAKEE